MLNKLKSLLPEKGNWKEIYKRFTHEEARGYNECIKDIEALLPDILTLIREEIGKMKYETYPNSEVENWKDKSKCLDYHNKAIDDILNILK